MSPMPAPILRTSKIVHLEHDPGFDLEKNFDLAYVFRQKYGYDIDYVRCGLLSEAREFVDDPSVVAFIIDLILPKQREEVFAGLPQDELPSLRLIRQIRQRRQGVSVIVLTNYYDDPYLMRLVHEEVLPSWSRFRKLDLEDHWEEFLERLGEAPGEARRNAPQRDAKLKLVDKLTKLRFQAVKSPTHLDPRLQFQLALWRRGRASRASSSTLEGEVAVIARVSDLDSWRRDSRAGIAIPLPDGREWIVTGRVRLDRLDQVARAESSRVLEAARPLLPALSTVLQRVRARVEDLPALKAGSPARNVVLGVVDNGCDFALPNFRHLAAPKRTRLLALWDQGTGAPSEAGDYGVIYSAADIDFALESEDPYGALDYEPAKGAHGTRVLDIAGGAGAAPGLASAADLVFVEVSGSDLGTTPEELSRQTLGDSVHLLEAVEFIFARAAERNAPCVVNISLGTHAGPHDGSSPFELGIDGLLAGQKERAVVLAAGNAHELGIHAAGELSPGSTQDLCWEVRAEVKGHVVIQIWFGEATRLALDLVDPSGTSSGKLALEAEEGHHLLDSNGDLLYFIGHWHRPDTHDRLLGLYFAPPVPAGRWCLRLHSEEVGGLFHAWIERSEDPPPASFLPPHVNPSCTLSSIACGRESIVTAAYDGLTPEYAMCSFSSAGPTRDNRDKPDLSAPGAGLMVAEARSEGGLVESFGTSFAAPVVSGVVAMMLAEARALGLHLTAAQVRDILTETASKLHEKGWNCRSGWGSVDARAALERVHALARR